MVHTLRLDNYYPTPRKLVLGTNSSFGTESIKIERGAGWDGLNLTATWHIPGREEPLRVALLDGDAMDVPPEVTKEAKDGVLVLAGLASGVQRASCNVEYLIIEQAGVYGGADAEPTPELAAQVLEAALQAKADAEAAAEDAAAAKANADKAQSDAEKAQQAAENAAADAAKAGPYAEAARAAQEAAESARNGAIAAQQAAENAAAAAAASKNAADTLAAEAARAAQAAENFKAAANNAADLAGENATAAQQAATTATAAANDAGQSASDAAASKAAAKTAAKAAQDAQTAAAEAKAEAVKALGAAQTAAKSAQDAQAAAEKAREEVKAAQKGAEAARDAAAKSAADADRTANSINESMMQIAANKEAVGQLKEDLANYEDALDIKLYKASLAESAPGIGLNWNLYYDMSIPAGTKVSVTLNSYSGSMFTNMSLRFFDANGNMKNYGSIKSIGGNIVITTTDDYTRLWLQINRSGIENGVNTSITFATNRSGVLKALTDLENTLNKKINEEILKASIVHTFYVEKDGTGDFTKLIDAIDEAEKYMDSVVYVGNGEWDIIDELGSDYVNSVSYTKRGIVLKNRIKLVFSSKSKVICDYSGDNTAVKNWLSPFNAGKHGFTLENLNIYSHNVRYSMHDERGSDGDFYINRYINCHFFNHNEKGGFRQCIGGGLGKNGYIVIENCVFENPKANNNSLVSYHNTANVGGGPAKSNIEVSNCYVKGSGTLRFSWYGTSTDITIVKASGNNLGSAIQFVAETSDGTSPNENVELYEWNNIIRSN